MVGTIEQAIDMKRDKPPRIEEISDWELSKLPNGIRIDIPLKSVMHMRKIAPLLQQFGAIMDRESRNPVHTSYQAMERMWFYARTLRKKIEEICNPLAND